MLSQNRISGSVDSLLKPVTFFSWTNCLGFLIGCGFASSIIGLVAYLIFGSQFGQNLLATNSAVETKPPEKKSVVSPEYSNSKQFNSKHFNSQDSNSQDSNSQDSNSKILAQIAQASGLSTKVKITVCNLQRTCWHLRGNQIPISVASLMKVPIAVTLLDRVNRQKIPLNNQIYIREGNFTEDASDLEVEQNYPLGKLLLEMIVNSSNIAANQLIDYLGRNYINQVLESRGYRATRVHAKFIGDIFIPDDAGEKLNTSTTNELTEMMVQIYNRQYPGDDRLISLLGQQHDRELGLAALKGSSAKWLGEKTGQNSWVIGTTLAMEISGNKYILTVIDDGVYADAAIRNAIRKIADYIAQKGHL
jgi:beta-lactamase class A